MDPLTVTELLVGALSIATIVGGILMRAFVNPIKDEVNDLKEADTDKEKRLRKVETQTTVHAVHISTLVSTSERLLNKMDELVSAIGLAFRDK